MRVRLPSPAMEEKDMYVYQLKATGDYSCFGGSAIKYSSTVFSTRENAEKRREKFKRMITDDSNILSMDDNDRLKITIEKLEVVE